MTGIPVSGSSANKTMGAGIGYNQAGTTDGTTLVADDWTDAVTQMNAALQSAGSEWRYALTGELPTLTKN